MASKNSPERIRLKDLNKAVEKAVELATERQGLTLEAATFGGDFHRVPWWLVGRRLREDFDLGEAYGVAEQITKGVQESVGVEMSPVVTIIDRDILVGFIERFGGEIVVPIDRLGGRRG